MTAKNFTQCLADNSQIDITETGGDLIELDDSSNSITKITALKNGVDLECYELIELDDENKKYLDDTSYTAVGSNGTILFTKDHKIYCGEFIEN